MKNKTIIQWPKELAGMALVETGTGQAVYLQRARYGGGYLVITDTRIYPDDRTDEEKRREDACADHPWTSRGAGMVGSALTARAAIEGIESSYKRNRDV